MKQVGLSFRAFSRHLANGCATHLRGNRLLAVLVFSALDIYYIAEINVQNHTLLGLSSRMIILPQHQYTLHKPMDMSIHHNHDKDKTKNCKSETFPGPYHYLSIVAHSRRSSITHIANQHAFFLTPVLRHNNPSDLSQNSKLPGSEILAIAA